MGYGPSRQDRGAGNSGEQPVQFKLADAQRIANVVGQVEGSRRGRKGSTLPRAAGGGGGSGVQRAKWFCTPGMVWRTEESYPVRLVSDTTQTVSAKLEFGGFTAKSFVVNLALMSEADATTGNLQYYVLAHECG